MSDHHRRLVNLFHTAPIQDFLSGASMKVDEGTATYTLQIKEAYFHAAAAMHGAIYFKMLDDAAYFAAASTEEEYFILTKSYTIHFRRLVEVDTLIATGELVSAENGELIAKSKITNSAGKVVANGEGIFVKGPKLLSSLLGYGD